MIRLGNPFRLRRTGTLCMNARNHAYIHAYNPRRFYPRVDDKLQTKLLAQRLGLAGPRLIGVVRFNRQVRDVPALLKDETEFVIKPTKGSGGKGILVVVGRTQNGEYIKPSGETLDNTDLFRHVSNILSGLYSLGGQTDCAMVEQYIHFTDAFAGYSYQGVPDVRVIVFQGYPVLAMMRCSTADSDGKANLHQGAVGVGIDIVTGRSRGAVQYDRPVKRHPDTGREFDDLRVPEWDKHLLLATRCYEMTHLGYFGADIVLDRDAGPVLLELNARPGLAIQIANGIGLVPRLKRIEALDNEFPPPPEQRVAFAKNAFTSSTD
ncbi:MAG: alpha-L-glutamate ligase-like protein [Phycisphaerae bacterium]|nr:alpha-L-glutamate ligase-like protein [Phycisphaerae bacterium]